MTTTEEWNHKVRGEVFDTDEWRAEYKAFEKAVPRLTETELAQFWPRIQPVIRKNGTAHYIKEVNPSNVAYTWSPELKEEATGLKEIARKTVFVTWAYYGFFKPTIRECLAQMPKEISDQCVAFEIVKSPETAEDFHKTRESSLAFDAGFHTCEVVYYGSEK